MQDFIPPFWWTVFFRWRARVRNHGLDFPAKALRIEFEGGFALPAEKKIRVQLHDRAPFDCDD
jgi:hypothetical protein